MTLALSPRGAALGTIARLLSPTKQVTEVEVVDITPGGGQTIYDHVVASKADLPAPSGGLIDLTSGSWAFTAPVALGTDALRVQAGQTVYLYGTGWSHPTSYTGVNTAMFIEGVCVIESFALTSANRCIEVTGGVLQITNSLLTGVYCFVLNGATSELFITECQCLAAGRAISVASGQDLRVSGSDWVDTSGSNALLGLRISGDLLQTQLIGVTQHGGADFVQRTSGTQEFCAVTACATSSNVGIDWAAASLPSQGIVVLGSLFDSATPFNGFGSASARTNIKACVGGAGLLTETAIVP